MAIKMAPITMAIKAPKIGIRAVMVVQLKVMRKYDEFITILLSQIWGNEPRHQQFRKYIYQYMNVIETFIKEGIDKGVFRECNTRLIAEMLFGTICPLKIYKIENIEEFDVEKIL